MKRAFAKYVRFDGRASRSEFWWFYLFNAIVSTVLSIPYIIAYVGQAPAMMNGEPPQLGRLALADSASLVWSLVVLLPTLGLFWRRLHDTGRSGAWWFLSFACGIGALVPLIMCILDSDPTGQRYDRVHDARGPAPGGYGR
nr:DUF805 domain-containing protein [Microlunatus sp. Gsoil 973]